MTGKQTWLITGAGRGMGVEFANAALAAGHSVVATGRNPDAVAHTLGESEDLLVVKLDVTSTQDAEAAVNAAVDWFGRIDVLVNNAASFYAGYFEELTAEQMERQLATSLIGPMNVTRARHERYWRHGATAVDLRLSRGDVRVLTRSRQARRARSPNAIVSSPASA
jgi:NAD(P)-dependent dehydrogenase (short-subunit alcohol dehydrogenase family)